MIASALLLFFLSAVHAQAYCRCESGGPVNDPLQQCFTAGNYSVQNSCYVCPVQNSTAKYYFCDSLYRLGFGTCGQPGAVAAMRAACLAIGGDIASPDFRCLNNGGFDQSQVNGCANSSTTPTASPTSDASSHQSGTPYTVLMFIGLSIVLCL